MKRSGIICAVLALLLATMANESCAKGPSSSKPNVILLYGDDVGYGDVGIYNTGSKIPTPNIDRLAAQGLRFTDAHCAAATCTPSRYSLLTGEMAFRKEGTGIAAGDAEMIIDPGQYTLADLFHENGYRTAVVGKWHLGLGKGRIDWNGKIEPGPETLGFDQHFLLPATNDRVPSVYVQNGHVVGLDPNDPITVSYRGRIPDSVPGTEYPDAILQPEAVTRYKGDRNHSKSVINGFGRIGYMKGGKSSLWKDEEMVDDFVREASKFIRENSDKPFFLFFSANDIHAPRWPHERFRGMSEQGLRGDAMVSFDWSVGALLALLDELELADDTIVILSSDNGPVYIDGGYQDGCETRGSGGVDRGHAAAGPFRGGKYKIYEGGTRVPFIVRWPGRIEPGVSEALFSQTDLLASFATFFGTAVPEGQAPDSRDFWSTLMGKEPGEVIILEEARRQVALRLGTWKYIGGEKPQLYDLSKDIAERNNVLKSQPEVAERMERLFGFYEKHPLTTALSKKEMHEGSLQ